MKTVDTAITKKVPDHVGKRRLLALASFLEELPRKRFDYGDWIDEEKFRGKDDLSCGTAGCAMGWAPQVPSLRRAGLRFKGHINTRRDIFSGLDEKYYTYTVYLNDEPTTWIDAGQDLFGIQFDEFMYLFQPGYSHRIYGRAPSDKSTPKQVAKHIRSFVAKRYPEKKAAKKGQK